MKKNEVKKQPHDPFIRLDAIGVEFQEPKDLVGENGSMIYFQSSDPKRNSQVVTTEDALTRPLNENMELMKMIITHNMDQNLVQYYTKQYNANLASLLAYRIRNSVVRNANIIYEQGLGSFITPYLINDKFGPWNHVCTKKPDFNNIRVNAQDFSTDFIYQERYTKDPNYIYTDAEAYMGAQSLVTNISKQVAYDYMYFINDIFYINAMDIHAFVKSVSDMNIPQENELAYAMSVINEIISRDVDRITDMILGICMNVFYEFTNKQVNIKSALGQAIMNPKDQIIDQEEQSIHRTLPKIDREQNDF
jgi:hypothetical protein